MSAIRFIRPVVLVRVALLATFLALNACAALTSRPTNQANGCTTSFDEPIQVCNTSDG